MDNIGCAQERSLIPRAKKKKKAKNELDPLKQAERKRRRLEKALATSAAIRSELEEKKQRKKEQQQLDEEGAAIAEAVALHALCEDSDDSCQIVLNNHSMDLDSLQEQDSNVGLFIGGWKASMPRSGVGKYSIKGHGWVSDAYGSGCNCTDRGIRWSFASKIVDQGLPALCVKGKGEAAETSPGLIAAQAVSSLQIREDAHCNAFTGKETSTKITGSCLGRNANLYEEVIYFFKELAVAMGKDVKFKPEMIYKGGEHAAGVTWHLEWKGKEIPFTKGCSFYECKNEGERLVITRARIVIEAPLKPGVLVLKLLRTITYLFDQFPQLTERFLVHHRMIFNMLSRIYKMFIEPIIQPIWSYYTHLWRFTTLLLSCLVKIIQPIINLFIR